MYAFVVLGIGVGALSPLALRSWRWRCPRAIRAVRVMGQPAPTEAPAGYVGWPLWYHRVCLVHNRAFGWLLILGLAAGAVWPSIRVG